MQSLLFSGTVVMVSSAMAAAVYLLLLFAIGMYRIAVGLGGSSRGAHGVGNERVHQGCVSFTIVIPAHNEQASITQTISACRSLNYSCALYRIIVIADNCTDATARLASQAGATVLFRDDTRMVGKGAALAWAIPKVLECGDDVVVVLDADCAPHRELLCAFDQRIRAGQRVLQCAVVVTNGSQSAAAYVASLGSVTENEFIAAPKEVIGGAVFLRGTGMAFVRDVLEANSWSTATATEDHDFSLRLLMSGERIHFVPETAVFTKAETSTNLMRLQRRRWSGALVGSFEHAARLFAAGVRKRSLFLIDAALMQLVMSRVLVLGQLLLTALLAAFVSQSLLKLSFALCAAHAVMLVVTVLRCGITLQRVGYFLSMPRLAGMMLLTSLRGIFGNPGGWAATSSRRENWSGDADEKMAA